MRSAASTASLIARSASSTLMMEPERTPRESWWPTPRTLRLFFSSASELRCLAGTASAMRQLILVEPMSSAAMSPPLGTAGGFVPPLP